MSEPPVICFTGERLAFGPMSLDLAPLVLRWHNDFTASRNVWYPDPQTAEQDLARYERAVSDPNAVRFTAYERESRRPIGRCSLNEIDFRNRTAEFGVLVGDPADRGKGFGTEMARAMLDYGFTALGLHNVMLVVAEFNVGGIRAYEKAGFREFGRRRQAFRSGGRYWDDILMECLATEFTSPYLANVLAPDPPRS